MSVSIIGAGVGGLTTALALRRKGFRVMVFEQAPKFIETVGSGFAISPNGQYCLAALGLHQQMQPVLNPLLRWTFVGKDGSVLGTTRLDHLQRDFGTSLGGALRHQVIEMLAAPLIEEGVLQYNSRAVNVSQDERKITIELQDGRQVASDVVVSADGIHNAIGNTFGVEERENPVYSSENIFYGTIYNPHEIQWKNPVLQDMENRMLQGFSGSCEFISFSLGRDAHYRMWAATYRSDNSPKRSEWGFANHSAELEKLMTRYESGHMVHELAKHTKVEHLLHFGLFYRKPRPVWSKGRFVLLGDAAHATLPYIGQGANMAIEDGFVLGEALANHGVEKYEDAFKEYYAKRFDRTKTVVEIARRLGTIIHSENFLVQKARDWILVPALCKTDMMLNNLKKEMMDHAPVSRDEYRKITGL